jgi:hypothetical protein
VRAPCGRNVVRYEVVERNWLRFDVVEVCDDSPGKDQKQVLYDDDSYQAQHTNPRHLVRTFWKQESAIRCANGLVSGTWSPRGPIRFSIELFPEQES